MQTLPLSQVGLATPQSVSPRVTSPTACTFSCVAPSNAIFPPVDFRRLDRRHLCKAFYRFIFPPALVLLPMSINPRPTNNAKRIESLHWSELTVLSRPVPCTRLADRHGLLSCRAWPFIVPKFGDSDSNMGAPSFLRFFHLAFDGELRLAKLAPIARDIRYDA